MIRKCEKRIRQKDVAKAIGYAPSLISMVVSGRRNASKKMARRLAAITRTDEAIWLRSAIINGMSWNLLCARRSAMFFITERSVDVFDLGGPEMIEKYKGGTE